MQDKLIEAEIDDGILGVVLVLNDAGVKTFSSCQGGGYGWGHGYLRPIVCFDGDDSEGERAEKIATDAGYQVFQVQRVWYTRDGERVGPFWEMEFVAGAACRAPKDRAAVRAHDAGTDEGLKHLIPSFLTAMNDVGQYGFEQYGPQSFQARRMAGDSSRGLGRCQPQALADHAQEHFSMYLQHIPHDHFGDDIHQLAAVAFNAMMEAYFAGLTASHAAESAPQEPSQQEAEPDIDSLKLRCLCCSTEEWIPGCKVCGAILVPAYLLKLGYRISADGTFWIPPVNESTGKWIRKCIAAEKERDNLKAIIEQATSIPADPPLASTAQLDAEDQHRAAEPGEEEMGRAYGMVTVEEADAELADRRTK